MAATSRARPTMRQDRLSRCLAGTLGVALAALAVLAREGPGPVAPARPPELIPQAGHSDKVRTVAFSPDGRVLASAGSDRRIKLWDAASGALLRTLTGHQKRVECVAFSPDGRRLASTGPDSTLRLWELDTGETAASLERKNVEAPSVAFSPDGTKLAWAVGQAVELWEPGLKTQLRRLEGQSSGVLSVAFGPDGRLLAAGARDGSIRLWDAASGARRATLTGADKPASSLAFGPDGTLLATTQGNAVVVWDVAAGRPLRTLTGHSAEVLSVAFSRDGSRLASGGRDDTVRLWDRQGTALRTLAGHTGRFGWVYGVAFSPDGATLASASEDTTVKLWNVGNGTERDTLGGRTERAEAVAFSADGKLVVVGGLGIDSDVQLWGKDGGGLVRTLSPPDRGLGGPSLTQEEERFAVESLESSLRKTDAAQFDVRSARLNFSGGIFAHGEAMRRILMGFPGAVRSVAFSPDGKRLLSGSLSRVLRVWDMTTGSLVRTLTAHSGVVRAVAYSPDGRRFASGGEDAGLKIWDASSFYLQKKIAPAHSGPVLAVAFSPDGRWIASGAEQDQAVKVWDAESGLLLHGLPGHEGDVYALAFSWDGRALVTAAGTGGLRVWDPATGQLQKTIPRDELGEWPTALAFSRDSSTMAVGTYAGLVRLLDWPSGRPRQTLAGHSGPVWSVAFSPDGRLLVSGSDDTTVRYWNPATGELLATATGRGNEWLVTAPDGLFDGSPGGWGDVRWRFSQRLFDTAQVEAFFNEFYDPGLLAELLAGKRPHAQRDVAQLDRRQPKVKLRLAGAAPATTIPARSVGVWIEVSEAAADAERGSGGVRDVRLFRNGSLVKVWRGDVSLNTNGKAVLEATIPIIAGENRLSAYSFNRDNIKSADAELIVTGADSLKRAGTAYIVAVGINKYANKDYNLSYAVADAKAFAEELRRQQTKLGTYASVQVISLLNQDATKANILRALARLAGTDRGPLPADAPADLGKLKPAEPEDAVFVYYAGHGTAAGPRFYLIPHDLGYQGNREELDAAGLKMILEHSLSDQDLEHAFEKVDAGRLLLVIDACNSGQALEAEEKRRGPMNSKGLAQLAYEKGMYILTAAQGYQAALEAAQLGHGYLTFALVEEGLKTAAADTAPKDGQVVVREWLDYATQRVPQMQETSMQEARKVGREVAFVEGDEKVKDLAKRSLQRPRVFYRREPEALPLVVARPEARP